MSFVTSTRAVVSAFREENVTFLAASVAFYAFLSIIPLLLLTVAIGSLVGGQMFADRIVSLVEGQLSSQGAMIVEEALTSSAGRSGASLVSIVTLTWSALKVFRGISLAFDEVYQTDPDTSLLGQLVGGFIVLVTVGLAVVLMVALGTVLGHPALVSAPFVNALGWAVLVAGLTVVLLPLYYVMPPVDISVREALPGTLVASVGWLGLQAGFQLYAANASQYQAYGFLGAVLLFLLWLYFASALVLFGAVVNAVLGGEARER